MNIITQALKELNESINLNKDFYDKLPSFACEHLDNLISEHGEEDWFEDAWNKYRNHILNSDMEHMKMPGSFFDFNKHLDARTKGAIKKGWIDAETGKAINTPLNLKEDLIIVEADKVKDKLYALKDEIEKAEGNLKFFLMDLFAVYMYHAFWGGVPTSSEERDELKAKGISTDELIHSDLTKKEWDELAEWEKGIKVEFKK